MKTIMQIQGCRGNGIRNLNAFNKALLAKQVWRIIQSPNSLMARTMKGVYFKILDMMIAALGSNPSYVWRSLLWSRDMIKKCLRWRVGNRIDIGEIILLDTGTAILHE